VPHPAPRAVLAAPLLLALTFAACGHGDAPRRPAAVPVSVATVQPRDVPYEIGAIGNVTPIQTVAIRAQVTGTLIQVAFQEGDEVQQGQLLFQIDPRPFQAALDQARANLAKDRAGLVNAQQEVVRYQQLAQNDLATQEQYDQYEANAQAAAAAVTADSAAMETARLNLDYTTIRAPIAGRTGSLLIREGNLVAANGTTPLVIINQIRPIAVSFSVPQKYLDDIQHYAAAHPLEVRVHPTEDSTAVLVGRLTFINNQVDTTTGTIQLKATFANDARALWPGEFVTATLVLDVEKGALTVPSEAVMTGQNGSYVYIVDADGTARTQDVTEGRSVNDYVVIAQGLGAGQRVVTDGQLRLVPGAKVEIKPAANVPTASAP